MSLLAKNDGRQYPDVAKVAFDFNDIPAAEFYPAVELPSDAIVLGVSLAIDSAFDATRTISVGVSGTADKYLDAASATATAISRAADTTLNNHAPLGGSGEVIGLTPSGTMSQGSGTLIVEYVRSNREHHTHG